MSWNNALPWWLYSMIHEGDIAEMTCCFHAELAAGFTRSTPKHVILIAQQRRKETEGQLQKDYESL